MLIFSHIAATMNVWIFLVRITACLAVVTTTAAVRTSTNKDQNDKTKVFILAGQSNMVGMGAIDHLDTLVNDATRDFGVLWDSETQSYKERDDVYIKYDEVHDPLTVSRTAGYAGSNAFGPEVMFGWTVGDAMQTTDSSKVLLIKTAWGGKTLAIDFRPPSAGEGNYGQHPVHYGWLYRTMVQDVLDTLSNLNEYVPDYNADIGYELAGFLWFQGWNDMLNWDTVNEYGPNLVKFIRDVRLDLDAPNLPFVIGELGMHGPTPEGQGSDRVLAMRAAQHSVALLDEFVNTTRFVRTAPYAVLNDTAYNGIYHYNGRADTYFYMGRAMGQGMLELLGFDGSTESPSCGSALPAAQRKNDTYAMLGTVSAENSATT